MDWTKASEELARPLERSHVKSRQQGGRGVSYIESWHAIAEANRIFGFDGWSSNTLDIKCVAEKPRKIGKGQYEKDGWGVSYTARVRVLVGDVIRDGVGAGHGIDADLGQAHESAIKEAESDARKRALMSFGNQFGLALYDKEQANVSDGNGHEDKPQSASVTPPTATFTRLVEELSRIETDAGLGMWIGGVKEAISAGTIKPSEKTELQNRLDARRAFLAQAPGKAA